MCEVRSKEKAAKNPQKKLSTLISNKKMDYDEPHFVSNEKTQPIQHIEWGIGALVATGSFLPLSTTIL